jgi:hypothetical protein
MHFIQYILTSQITAQLATVIREIDDDFVTEEVPPTLFVVKCTSQGLELYVFQHGAEQSLWFL